MKSRFRRIAAHAALAVAAVAIGGEAFAQGPPATSNAAGQGFAPPPPPSIPASFKRRPRGVPADAVLLAFQDSPDLVSFIYYFPARIREVKDGYDVRTAYFTLDRKNARDTWLSMSLTYVECGYPSGTTFWGNPVAPGSPIGIARYVNRSEKDVRASGTWSNVSLPQDKAVEISRWLDSSPTDEEWNLVGRNHADTLLNQPMDADPNRGAYVPELLIRTVCASRPVRHRP